MTTTLHNPNNVVSSAFTPFELETGLCLDLHDDEWPTRLFAINQGELELADDSTHYIYCHQGSLSIYLGEIAYTLQAGMYAMFPGGVTVYGRQGSGIAISRIGYEGWFQLGGPIEPWGRLCYIDGCTDSLLLSPLKMGDPCLNALFFPPGTDQTMHTHPSMRVGMVIRGTGECVVPEGVIPLFPGQVFIIHQDGEHKFRTPNSEGMVVVAYHPDSDFGPQDEDHPMLNRTIVDGTSAKHLNEIRTKLI
jgi:quercetin dioxygenase-like cupin family protein|tara:strand:- start:40 stop:783 length:744 start_codon:yes stop_codon:yes gene_type:complete